MKFTPKTVSLFTEDTVADYNFSASLYLILSELIDEPVS
jgi:hypothetical protein